MTKQTQGQPAELETRHKQTVAGKRKTFPRGSVNTRLFDLRYVWGMVFTETEAGEGGREEKERTLPVVPPLGRARLMSHVLQFTRPRHEEWALGQDEGSKLCITPGKTGEPFRRSRDP